MTIAPTDRDTPVWVRAATVIGGFVAALYVIEVIDTILNHRLDAEGVQPREADGLIGIVFAPLLHGGWGHLVANTGPALVLGFLIALSGVVLWLKVTAYVWIIGGVGTWLIGPDNTVHIGASGLIFGWLVFLILRGIFSRQPGHVIVGLVILFLYGGLLFGVLPGDPGVSWQGHLFGAIGGGIAAWQLAERKATRAR